MICLQLLLPLVFLANHLQPQLHLGSVHFQLQELSNDNAAADTTSIQPSQHQLVGIDLAKEEEKEASNSNSNSNNKSKWARRTARKRDQTGRLLQAILEQQQWPFEVAPAWNDLPEFKMDDSSNNLVGLSLRIQRKQSAVQAFCQITNTILLQQQKRKKDNEDGGENNPSEVVIVDAASGAGNLALALAKHCRWFQNNNHRHHYQILAIDINPVALQRLEQQWRQQQLIQQQDGTSGTTDTVVTVTVETLCADLAASTLLLPPNTAVVCSLHACGAATDLALLLAMKHHVPFVVSPCCTAKAVTLRRQQQQQSSLPHLQTIRASTSRQRSAAPPHLIQYPRSKWLVNLLQNINRQENDTETTATTTTYTETAESLFLSYTQLAKVADVGLGPQTPHEQRIHQQQAKWIVECDRLAQAVEQYDYRVQLWRLPQHENYGKAEVLIGFPPPARAGAAQNHRT